MTGNQGNDIALYFVALYGRDQSAAATQVSPFAKGLKGLIRQSC